MKRAEAEKLAEKFRQEARENAEATIKAIDRLADLMVEEAEDG